jgi:hypothetical protein
MGWLGNRECISMMLWSDFHDAQFRIQARNPFISCMVILVQFFSEVGILPASLLITCCAYLSDSVTMRVRITSVKKR